MKILFLVAYLRGLIYLGINVWRKGVEIVKLVGDSGVFRLGYGRVNFIGEYLVLG